MCHTPNTLQETQELDNILPNYSITRTDTLTKSLFVIFP